MTQTDIKTLASPRNSVGNRTARRPAVSDSRPWRALRRFAGTLRNLYQEQEYGWERYFRAGLPPRAGTHAPGGRSGRPRAAGPSSPAPADAGQVSRASAR